MDDNVRLEIFNKKFRAQKLDVIGFKSGGKSNGKQTLAVEVKKGKYTIEAYLEQILVNRFTMEIQWDLLSILKLHMSLKWRK